MASDVDSKQNEATCSNKTKPKLIFTRKMKQHSYTYFIILTKRHKAHNTLQKLTKINY